jgi:hypothetical protein
VKGFSIFNLNPQPKRKNIMADYFTNFSLVLPLPDQAAQAYALDLAEKASQILQGEEVPADFPPSLKQVTEDWQFETDAETTDGKPAVWLHSDTGGIDAVCAFIQHLLQKYDPASQIIFEWSHDCSKPRTDAYGGGAAIVTAQEIKTMSTSQWLQENIGLLTPPQPYA